MKPYLLKIITLASLLSMPAQAQEPATPSAADAPAPKIVCDEPVFDFGEKDNAGFVEHDYTIRNEGTLPLEISQVYSSCGCTAVKPSEYLIPPGGETSIHAKFDLKGRSGMQVKKITVNSNDPRTPSLVLELKGTLLMGLGAKPSSLFFGRVETNSTRIRTFDIVSGRGPIRIESYRTDNPGLVLTPVAAEPGGDGSTHRFELALDPSLPEGNISGSAFVKTDSADQPEITIPVSAYIVPPPPSAPEEAVPQSRPIGRRDISTALDKLMP